MVARARAHASRAVVLFLVLSLCVASIPTAAATQSVDRAGSPPVAQVATPSPSPEDPNSTTQTTPSTPTNDTVNTTDIRHRNPTQVREDGNITELEFHLSQLLADRLGNSIIELERGEYDRARALIGSEYDRVFDRYVTVSRERRGDGDRRFKQAGGTQRDFIDSVAEYREKQESYQEAKQTGDEERARALARDLNEIADRSTTTRDRLVDDYTTLETDTGLSFATEVSRVEALTQEIEAQQAQIRSAEFFSTALTLTSVSPTGSFEEPIAVRGQVVTEDEATEAVGPATFTVAGQAHPVQVNDSGAFEFTYRPTTVPVGRQTLRVAFLPRNDSVYLGSNTTIDVTIQQVTPSVSIDESPARTAFGSEYRVAGRVAVGDVPVSGVNVTLWMGGTPLNVTATDETGAVQFVGILPAAVPPGDRTVRLGLPEGRLALASTTAEEPIAVASTATSIDIEATLQALESVAVSGTLATRNGDLVAGQPVDISFDGTVVGTAVTDRNGAFDTVLWVPPDLGTSRTLTVEASFDGSGKNLDSTRGSDTVTLPARRSEATEGDSIGLQSSFAGVFGIDVETLGSGLFATLLTAVLGAPVWSGVLALVGLAVVGVLAWRRRPEEAAGAVANLSGREVTVTDRPGSVPVDPLPALLLDLARDRLSAAQPVEAVTYSYLATRLLFVHTRGVPKHGTHREFLRAASAGESLSESERDRLRDVTTGYEQAVFSSTPPTEADAAHLIDVSASLFP